MEQRRVIGVRLYRVIINAYDAQGNSINHAAVARQCGIDQRTSARLYNSGLRPNLARRLPGLPAIKEVLAGRAVAPIDVYAEREEQDEIAGLDTPPAPPPPPAEEPQAPVAEIRGEEVPVPVIEATTIEVEEEPEAEPYTVAPTTTVPTPPIPEPVQVTEVLPPKAPSVAMATPVQDNSYIAPSELQTHAVGALREELRAVGAARNALLGVHSIATQILVTLQGQAKLLQANIQRELDMGASVVDQVQLIKSLAKVTDVITGAGAALKQMVEAERLALGSPTEIVKLVGAAAPVAKPQEEDPQAASGRLASVLAALGKFATPAPSTVALGLLEGEAGGGEGEPDDVSDDEPEAAAG
jgi:hypothetical protein